MKGKRRSEIGEVPEPVDSMSDQTASATKRVTLIFPLESDDETLILRPLPFSPSSNFWICVWFGLRVFQFVISIGLVWSEFFGSDVQIQ